MSRRKRTASSEVSKIKEADALEALAEDALEVGAVVPTLALDKPWWVDASKWNALNEEQKQQLINRS